MKKVVIGGLFMVLCVLPSLVMAQTDNFGNVDTLYIDVERINPSHFALTISYTNDQPVAGLSVPIQMTGGKIPVLADSAVYTGGRVENFSFKGFRPDTGIQCVTLGMIANLSSTDNVLKPGTGRLVTVFVSSMDDRDVETFLVDTTTTHPDNSMMMIADRSLLGPPDSTLAARMKTLEIVPALVIRKAK